MAKLSFAATWKKKVTIVGDCRTFSLISNRHSFSFGKLEGKVWALIWGSVSVCRDQTRVMVPGKGRSFYKVFARGSKKMKGFSWTRNKNRTQNLSARDVSWHDPGDPDALEWNPRVFRNWVCNPVALKLPVDNKTLNYLQRELIASSIPLFPTIESLTFIVEDLARKKIGNT